LLRLRKLAPIERFLLVATAVHGALYFAYWHDGFYLGPRFVTPWVPVLALLCVHAVRSVSGDDVERAWKVGLAGAMAAALMLTVSIAIPVRAAQYRAGLTSMREDYGAEAAKAGAQDALVFVHESWGAQLVARLWALGVSRSATAGLYAHTDACVLEHAVTKAEAGRVRGTMLEASLRHLMADSLLIQASSVSPDTTERMLPGSVYDSTCSALVLADREGYALYPPFLLDNVSSNTYARDLGARDSLLMDANRGRSVFVVTRAGVDGTSPLRWIRVR
jgi:hypothetical protein